MRKPTFKPAALKCECLPDTIKLPAGAKPADYCPIHCNNGRGIDPAGRLDKLRARVLTYQ